jgi:hypothetical protein
MTARCVACFYKTRYIRINASHLLGAIYCIGRSGSWRGSRRRWCSGTNRR